MLALPWAIKERQWQVAALCLLLGLMTALSQVPPDSIVGLLDVVNGGDDAPAAG